MNTGDNTQHTTPPFNKTPTQTERGTLISDGRDSITAPALQRHATHHYNTHPTIHNAPTHHHDEGGADEGYPTERTAQTDTHRHTPHTSNEQHTT
nr:MAG TPA: hypothetical protein [Caudoviricetes sp.]